MGSAERANPTELGAAAGALAGGAEANARRRDLTHSRRLAQCTEM
jgi:hypothetical protein